MKKFNLNSTLFLGGSFLVAMTMASCNNDSGDSKTVTTDTTKTMETVKSAPDTSHMMKDTTHMMGDTTHKDTTHRTRAMIRPVGHANKK